MLAFNLFLKTILFHFYSWPLFLLKNEAEKKSSRTLRHYLTNGSYIIFQLSRHFELVKVLKFFKKNSLIGYRTYVIYLFSYVSNSLRSNEKLEILRYHYSFLKTNFPALKISELFNEGIECYNEYNNEDQFSIKLAYSRILEFEGSLSLFFNVNDVKVFTLSFTFAPGEIFQMNDKTIIYVSCVQGVKNQFNNISKSTKYFQDIIPSVILMKVLEAIAVKLNVKSILGISARNQLSLSNKVDYATFYQAYDEFWINIGGKLRNENYVIPCPNPQKSILLIKQNHRNRAIKKRSKLDEIYRVCYKNVCDICTHQI